jgi:sugar lactone lactonase YvrE
MKADRGRTRRAVVVLAVIVGCVAAACSGTFPATPPTRITASTSTAATPPAPVLNRSEALAVTANENLLIANQGSSQILRRQPNGQTMVVAGTGTAGYTGDKGHAVDAELNNPGGLAIGSDGTIYLADTDNNRVRAISPRGTITTVAGNGMSGLSAERGRATGVPVSQPMAVAFARAMLYVVDDAGVQVVAKGNITTVIAAGPAAVTIDGRPTAFFPSAITVDPAGDLYVADFSPKLLIEFSPTGRVLRQWEVYVSTAGLVTAPDGTILVADYGNFAIDRLVGGRLVAVATFSLGSVPGLFGAVRPSGVAVGADGMVYADADGLNGGTSRPALVAVGADGRVRLLVPQPTVGVAPSEELLDGRTVRVTVSGFGLGERVVLSECSSAPPSTPKCAGNNSQPSRSSWLVAGAGAPPRSWCAPLATPGLTTRRRR